MANVIKGIKVGADIAQIDYTSLANKPSIPSYSNATTNSDGLLSSTDKAKLDGVAEGAEVNVQSNWLELNASSDAYIRNKPTIPVVNDSTITITQGGVNKGSFTTNQSGNTTINLDGGSSSGGYTPPTDGIPKTDLASDVQASLSKADTALQTHQDITGKQDLITSTNKLDYSLLSNTPTIPSVEGLASETYVTDAINNAITSAINANY